MLMWEWSTLIAWSHYINVTPDLAHRFQQCQLDIWQEEMVFVKCPHAKLCNPNPLIHPSIYHFLQLCPFQGRGEPKTI